MTRRLARLDERVVPALGRVIRGGGRASKGVAGATGRPGRAVVAGIRRYPVVATALALVALAAVLITVTGGDDRSAVRPKASNVVPAPADSQLGPQPGSQVSSYLAAAGLRSQQLSSLPATAHVTALLDLTGYLTPAAVTTMLAGRPAVTIIRGFARVPPPSAGGIHVLTVGSGAGLGEQLAAARSSARSTVAQYRLERRIEARHPSARLEAAIAAGAAAAVAARADAAGLGPTCGCVFALEVSGPVSRLLAVASLADVRVLDPAPPATSLADLRVVPLEPQVTGIVPQLQFSGE